ncbi:hypothetical protein ASPTUDRAFT_939307 [Aspergillus tubingensis CBS 134.48]|uniref:Uncharacterized protein n=1 Tax=Aspergillus tubingensis (strain CBS 134.48) TaxID=767770 RepID=A0A1L9MSK7_ASPTC|nr:hypothetical protein ASPTUDRAFT_939307 [Aspergillus tubingensis CBS 134.48]
MTPSQCTNCGRFKLKYSDCAHCVKQNIDCVDPPGGYKPSRRQEPCAEQSSSNILSTPAPANSINHPSASYPSSPIIQRSIITQTSSGYEPEEQPEALLYSPWDPESATKSPVQARTSFQSNAYSEYPTEYLHSSGPAAGPDSNSLHGYHSGAFPGYAECINESRKKTVEPTNPDPQNAADPTGANDILSCAGFAYMLEHYTKNRPEVDIIMRTTEHSLNVVGSFLEAEEENRSLTLLMLTYTTLAHTVTLCESVVAQMPLPVFEATSASTGGMPALKYRLQEETNKLADDLREQIGQCHQLVGILNTRLINPSDPISPYSRLTYALQTRLQSLSGRSLTFGSARSDSCTN